MDGIRMNGDGIDSDSNIIDAEYIEISFKSNNDGDAIKMPFRKETETREIVFEDGVKATEIKKEKVCYPIVTKIIILGLIIGVLSENRNKLIKLYDNNKDILTKSNNEESLIEEQDYDTALASAGATLNEQEPQVKIGRASCRERVCLYV